MSAVSHISDRQSDQGVIEAALDIAREWDKNVDLLCDAVIANDWPTAERLAKELKNNDQEID